MKTRARLFAFLSLTFAVAQGISPTLSHAFTREELHQRLKSAINRSMTYAVVLEDILGEGKNAWDADPRYPEKTVNCMIWLQLVLSEAYATTGEEKQVALDKIRYYGGNVGFSTRKHYTDHWMNVEPAPLKKVSLTKCAFPNYSHIKIRPEDFLKHRKFSCELYRMKDFDVELQYSKSEGLLKCQHFLPPGFYVFFAVPSQEYENRYLQETGPMGLVHAMILEIDPKAGTTVYHASTSAKAVLKEPLEQYLDRMKNLHLGYVVYELDPNWDYKRTMVPDPEVKKLQACEAKLPPNSSH